MVCLGVCVCVLRLMCLCGVCGVLYDAGCGVVLCCVIVVCVCIISCVCGCCL